MLSKLSALAESAFRAKQTVPELIIDSYGNRASGRRTRDCSINCNVLRDHWNWHSINEKDSSSHGGAVLIPALPRSDPEWVAEYLSIQATIYYYVPVLCSAQSMNGRCNLSLSDCAISVHAIAHLCQSQIVRFSKMPARAVCRSRCCCKRDIVMVISAKAEQ